MEPPSIGPGANLLQETYYHSYNQLQHLPHNQRAAKEKESITEILRALNVIDKDNSNNADIKFVFNQLQDFVNVYGLVDPSSEMGKKLVNRINDISRGNFAKEPMPKGWRPAFMEGGEGGGYVSEPPKKAAASSEAEAGRRSEPKFVRIAKRNVTLNEDINGQLKKITDNIRFYQRREKTGRSYLETQVYGVEPLERLAELLKEKQAELTKPGVKEGFETAIAAAKQYFSDDEEILKKLDALKRDLGFAKAVPQPESTLEPFLHSGYSDKDREKVDQFANFIRDVQQGKLSDDTLMNIQVALATLPDNPHTEIIALLKTLSEALGNAEPPSNLQTLVIKRINSKIAP